MAVPMDAHSWNRAGGDDQEATRRQLLCALAVLFALASGPHAIQMIHLHATVDHIDSSIFAIKRDTLYDPLCQAVFLKQVLHDLPKPKISRVTIRSEIVRTYLQCDYKPTSCVPTAKVSMGIHLLRFCRFRKVRDFAAINSKMGFIRYRMSIIWEYIWPIPRSMVIHGSRRKDKQHLGLLVVLFHRTAWVLISFSPQPTPDDAQILEV